MRRTSGPSSRTQLLNVTISWPKIQSTGMGYGGGLQAPSLLPPLAATIGAPPVMRQK